VSEPLTAEQEAELRRLEREATPGPWARDGFDLLATEYRGLRLKIAEVVFGSMSCNGELLLAARNALPALLASLDAARDEAARLRAAIERMVKAWDGNLTGDDYDYEITAAETMMRAALSFPTRRAGEGGAVKLSSKQLATIFAACECPPERPARDRCNIRTGWMRCRATVAASAAARGITGPPPDPEPERSKP